MARRGSPKRAGTKESATERVDARLGRFAADGAIPLEVTGRKVLVEGGIPNETVRLALVATGRKDRPRAEVISVLDPSPERVTPRCKVIDICGGCEWQHLSQNGQLLHKAAIVRRLLAAQRLPTRIDAVHPMPDPWAYRIRAQIALGPEAGFRMRRSKQIVGLRTCPVAHPAISRLLEELNRLIRLREIPDYRGKSLLHAQVAGSPAAPRLQLLLEGVDGLRLAPDAETHEVAERLVALRGVESVSVQDSNGQILILAGPEYVWVQLRGRDLALPAGSFFQSNWSLLPDLLDRAMELADPQPGEVAADIYGGVGLFGLFMATAGADVTLIEIDPRAVDAAKVTAAAWGLSNIDYVAAPAEEAVAKLPRLDLAIVDPPRTGLDETTIAALIERDIPRIVYVSCSPITYARDAAQLVRAGYRIEHYELFDFYPQTVHVEGLALLVKPDRGAG
ncbi:MAG TPA: 23S rRNA (uracil(1939)-C(5))-methyltransferase RlmD [Thermomicrobiales bacterium]|nr:23S rRNA (uracil(1939)-C(5))-methyltransferase RlmD [Thermomicrobiales bacterium]